MFSRFSRVSFVFLALVVFAGAGCERPKTMQDSYAIEDSHSPLPQDNSDVQSQPPHQQTMKTATLVTNKGTVQFELFPDTAPLAVNNLETLAASGYYNGIKVHRRVEDFVVQMGDPQTKELPLSNPRIGSGGPGYQFADELNDSYQYNRGILAMANAGPNTNGSQFFVMLADVPLPKLYTIFGRVTSGLEVIDALQVGDSITSLTVE